MKVIFQLFLLFPFLSAAQNNFRKEWLSSIVELQKADSSGNLSTHGTGFCLYNYTSSEFVYLVTCEHVLRNPNIYVRIPASDSATIKLGKVNKSIDVGGRIWLYDGFSFTTKVDLLKNKNFLVDPALDIGVVKFPYQGILMKTSKDTTDLVSLKTIANSNITLKKDIEVGTNIYFVGFPFGIGSLAGYYRLNVFSDVKINPLVRGDIVAWKSDFNSQFLIDGTSYNGNSGSPIFTQEDIFGKKGPSLIGMVLGHLRDLDIQNADLNQSLVRCIWIDEILRVKDKLELLPSN